ncbi:LysR family transcriptional regulator [Bacillus sp. X1(2014)]|uniref:LysR family transcriptional regulator n=1 Tax=Bacillus sp. X1(2014) TaxID=1565991 RepID=UPI0011A4F51F|nr:LysR family transcriptional regulator [Bacillus sp. X1(2014)]
MEIRLLEYFMAVCKNLHFTKAAEQLRISQPTLSHQIKLLEDRLGTPLFERVGKKVFITQAGKILLEHSEKIFIELDQIDIKIKEIRGLQRGKLTIGCSGNHLLTSSIIPFNSQYPEIELSIQEITTEEAVLGLLNHQLDIGVIFLDTQPEQLESVSLFTEELFLIVSDTHELVGRSMVKFQELQGIPMVFLPKKFLIRQFIDEICQNNGFTLRPIIELSTLDALQQMVSINKVASIMPKSYLKSFYKSKKIKQIPIVDPTPQKSVGIVYRKNAFMDKTTNTFIKHLIETYKHNG